MRKFNFGNTLNNCITKRHLHYKPRLEANLNYYLYTNSGLNHLSSCKKYINGSENLVEFLTLRDNYCFRTLQTPVNLAEMLKQALIIGDYETAAIIGENLHEETGEGNRNHSHPVFMLSLFDILSESHFALESLNLRLLPSSQVIADSTLYFVQEMQNLYTSATSYHTKIGAMLAHESTAASMLKLLYKILIPLISTLSSEQQKKCLRYFECHLNGVEQKHGQDMLGASIRICKSESDFKMIMDGVNLFHSRQSRMWSGLLKILESNAQNQHSSSINEFNKT